jgi:broad-specificity NMP kinase
MSKYLVTGFPGTGKTAVARELKRRGYSAYDPETMRGYMHLQNVGTGRPIHRPERPPRGWFDNVGNFNWDIPRVAALLDAHGDIFICSLADNQERLFDRFDKIFLLLLDDVTLEHRLRMRDNDLSKVPEQMADIMTLHKHFEASLINRGAMAINVNQAIHEVVNTILEHCNGSTPTGSHNG